MSGLQSTTAIRMAAWGLCIQASQLCSPACMLAAITMFQISYEVYTSVMPPLGADLLDVLVQANLNLAACISANLPNAWCSRQADGSAVLRRHLWLMQPPPGPRRLHHGVWHVVCVAALNAMDVGRKSANEFRMLQQQPQPAVPDPVVPGQPRITTLLQPAALTAAQQQHNDLLEQQRSQRGQQEAARRLAEAKEQAVARFWLLLTDFAIMHAAPDTWIPHVADDHP